MPRSNFKQCDNDTVACTPIEKLQNNGFGFAAITTIHYQKSSNILYQRPVHMILVIMNIDLSSDQYKIKVKESQDVYFRDYFKGRAYEF